MGIRQPFASQTFHPFPSDPTALATSFQCSLPQPDQLVAELVQRRRITGHAIVPIVSRNNHSQPLTLLGDGVMHALSQFDGKTSQLRTHALPHRLPQDGEFPSPSLPTDMGESQKMKSLQLAFSALDPVLRRKASEFDQARLVRLQFQVELPHPFRQFTLELLRVGSLLEARHKVVGVPDEDNISMRLPPSPLARPQIEHADRCSPRPD